MRFLAAPAASKPDIESASDADWWIASEQAAALEGLLLGRCHSLWLHTGLEAEWHSRAKR
jgi:hypothetical protein